MKVITIGRDRTQDICYDNEMISRKHAILRIYNNGRMEIVSLGQNGTFVNGNLCKPNTNYPLKRNDVVSFAHVCELEWSEIPDPLRWLKITSLVVGILAVIAVALSLTYKYLPIGDKDATEEEIELEITSENADKANEDWSNKLPKKDPYSGQAPQEKAESAPKAKDSNKEDIESESFKKYFKKVKKQKQQNKEQEKVQEKEQEKKQEKEQEKEQKEDKNKDNSKDNKEKNDSTTAIGSILI